MRRNKLFYIAFLVLLFVSSSAKGQDMYDALRFSSYDYFGSARSLSLGNAVTALGGDIGTIGINPAGSAVANYNQFTISLASNTSSTKSDFSIYGDDVVDYSNPSDLTKISIPNIGVSYVFYTGAQSGVKSFSLGGIINQTSNYTYHSNIYGINGISSKLGEMASAASGIDPQLMGDLNSFYNTDISWDLLTAYQGGLFGKILDTYDYAGVTEGVSSRPDKSLFMYNAGDINQTSIVKRAGSKNDVIINFGANCNDRLFLGVNIGLPIANYASEESFYESAVNPDQFSNSFKASDGTIHTTNFIKARTSYKYLAEVNGIYAKIGLIYTLGGLRFGLAYQTSSIYTINEKWKYYAGVNYSDSHYNSSQESPEGEYSYTLRTPSILNLGLAYTIANIGLISVDYELTNYNRMRLKELDYDYLSSDVFLIQNEAIQKFAGMGKSLRVGAEFRINPDISFRIGYNHNARDEYYYKVRGQDVYARDFQADYDSYYTREKQLIEKAKVVYAADRVTLGLGYTSNSSFFMDVAASFTQYPNSSYRPYYEYLAYDSTGAEIGYVSPSITSKNTFINAVLTLGWRF